MAKKRAGAGWGVLAAAGVLAAVGSAAAGNARGGKPDAAEVRRWIDIGNAQWMDGFRRADAAPIAESFAEDAVNVGRDGACDRGREAIRTRMAEFLKSSGPASDARVDVGQVVVDGDLAYEWGRSDARFSGRSGGPTRRAGRYLTCWKKQPDGSWKIYRNNSLPD